MTKTIDAYCNFLTTQIAYYENREDKDLFSNTIRMYKNKLKTAKTHENNSNFVVMSHNRVTFKYHNF